MKRDPKQNLRKPSAASMPLKWTEVAWHEALSRITPAVIHDVNNCLAGILSLSELCQLPGSDTRPLTEELGSIEQATQKANGLLRQLANLHQARDTAPGLHDLNHLVEETADLMKRVLGRHAQWTVQLAPEPLPVLVEKPLLAKVIILLLFVLADQRAEAGGFFVRSAASPPLAPPPGHVGAWPPSPLACLDIGIHNAKTPDLRHLFSLDVQLPGEANDKNLVRLLAVRQALDGLQGALALGPAGDGGEVSLRLALPRAALD